MLSTSIICLDVSVKRSDTAQYSTTVQVGADPDFGKPDKRKKKARKAAAKPPEPDATKETFPVEEVGTKKDSAEVKKTKVQQAPEVVATADTVQPLESTAAVVEEAKPATTEEKMLMDTVGNSKNCNLLVWFRKTSFSYSPATFRKMLFTCDYILFLITSFSEHIHITSALNLFERM